MVSVPGVLLKSLNWPFRSPYGCDVHVRVNVCIVGSLILITQHLFVGSMLGILHSLGGIVQWVFPTG